MHPTAILEPSVAAATYGWEPDAVLSQTIWNPDPASSIDLSNQTRDNIVDLRPGTYTVTFTLPGFQTFKREGITISAGRPLIWAAAATPCAWLPEE